MYQWLGEAQYAQGEFEPAIKSYRKSLDNLAQDASNDDAICGIMTAYVRIGDALAKLVRPAEAEAAYKTALSKTDPTIAVKHADLPALLPLAAAHAGLGNLALAAASRSHDPADAESLRRHGCDESAESQKIRKLIPAALAFNPVNYPVVPVKPADSSQMCNQPM